jgi:hypothetical protein
MRDAEQSSDLAERPTLIDKEATQLNCVDVEAAHARRC